MRCSQLLIGALLLLAGAAQGQLADANPDWKESEVPAPPSFKTESLLPLEMPRHLSMRFGVDPETLRVTPEGLVRYVLVATSPAGGVNAMYEGIRCQTGEVKTYARFTASGQWNLVQDAQWRALNSGPSSMPALALARQGACEGRAANAASPAVIIRRLKAKPIEGSQL